MPDQYPPAAFHRRLARPRLTIYRVSNPRRFACAWNRYDTVTIGAAVVIGSRCYSLTWARPSAEQTGGA